MTTVVVARYNENIAWTDSLQHDVVIYNKGGVHLKQNNIQLPNFGREADTMLYHITKQYNCLSEQTVFLQGDPFDHCWDVLKLISDNLDSDQLVWLGSNWGPVTKRFDSMPGAYLPILDVCYELFPNCNFDANTNFTFSAGAQYIVPRRLIINKSLNWWNHCYDVFKRYLNQHQSMQKSPSPWIFERIWPLIWNYTTND
jgi:hypothetical protein